MIKRDLTNLRFGYLTVLADTAERKHGRVVWVCQCDCGTVKRVAGGDLTTGHARSCGCERVSLLTAAKTQHGESGGSKTRRQPSPEYSSYQAAKQRCTNPNRARYEYYGGRGIKFLFSSFEQFLAVVGRRPSLRHSINRIDNDGNYEPGNVEWATPHEQAANTSRSLKNKSKNKKSSHT